MSCPQSERVGRWASDRNRRQRQVPGSGRPSPSSTVVPRWDEAATCFGSSAVLVVSAANRGILRFVLKLFSASRPCSNTWGWPRSNTMLVRGPRCQDLGFEERVELSEVQEFVA